MWRDYFKVVGIVPGKVVVPGFGTIDFSSDNIPVETCKTLFEADFIYLDITPKGREVLYGVKPKRPRKNTRKRKVAKK